MRQKDADRMANSVTLIRFLFQVQEQSDLGLQCLHRLVCPKTEVHYDTIACFMVNIIDYFVLLHIQAKTCSNLHTQTIFANKLFQHGKRILSKI